jgi:hypothetical protein
MVVLSIYEEDKEIYYLIVETPGAATCTFFEFWNGRMGMGFTRDYQGVGWWEKRNNQVEIYRG